MGRQIDFVDNYSDILRTVLGETARYIAGTRETGESFLLYASPLRHQRVTGLLFDLDRLHETVAESEVGQRLQDRGYGFDLFDADQASAFHTRYGETISVVAPASEWMESMRLGI